MGVVDAGIDGFLHLPERLSHHMDVVNVQEHQLSILIRILTFKSTPFHLRQNKRESVQYS